MAERSINASQLLAAYLTMAELEIASDPTRVLRERRICTAAGKVGGVTVGPHVGRNAPCPCGSGRKHKSCCCK